MSPRSERSARGQKTRLAEAKVKAERPGVERWLDRSPKLLDRLVITATEIAAKYPGEIGSKNALQIYVGRWLTKHGYSQRKLAIRSKKENALLWRANVWTLRADAVDQMTPPQIMLAVKRRTPAAGPIPSKPHAAAAVKRLKACSLLPEDPQNLISVVSPGLVPAMTREEMEVQYLQALMREDARVWAIHQRPGERQTARIADGVEGYERSRRKDRARHRFADVMTTPWDEPVLTGIGQGRARW